MFRFKNFKILLLLMLFAFVGQKAWADFPSTKYSYYVAYNKVKINKTGAGLVYTQQGTDKFDSNYNSKKAETFRNHSKSNDSNSAVCTEVVDKHSAKFTFYMKAEEKEGYKFVHWENEEGDVVSTEKYCSVNIITTNYCGEYTEAESKDESVFVNPQENNSAYYDALYTAVFEPLVKDPLIKVSSSNSNLGTTDITHEDNSDAVENDIGDDVVLFAYTTNYDKKFIGWQKDGEIVSRENPWHLQVSEENAGEYIAVFEDGYKFCRMKNFGAEHRYVTAVNDEGNLNNLTAIKLEDSFDNVIANAGSIIEIYSNTVYVPIPDGEGTKKVTYHDFRVQNSSGVDKNYYDFSAGVYLRLPHYTKFSDEGTWAFSQADITYNAEGKKTGLRFRDNNGQASFAALTNDLYSQWYIEPIDKDLETCENYFSLDPAKLLQVGNDYYTTLRTSWNILFNPEQMTPYIVKSVDETEGTFEMEPLTGNIIPAGTSVIIKTKSNDIEENRMVPTKTAAASGAVPAGNLLQSSTKYFPNQDNSNNLKPLALNANGQLAFSASAPSTINGNEAYLDVNAEVVLKPEFIPTTLDNLLTSGDTQNKYQVSADLSLVVAVDDDQLLICKENTELEMPEAAEGQIDYLATNKKVENPPHSRNRWVALRLPDGQHATTLMAEKKITNFFGKLTNAANAEIQLTKVPEFGEVDHYTPNTYVPASFQGTQTIGDKTYFFVDPQNMEYAHIIWAQWDGTKFVTIEGTNEAGQNINAIGLVGEFGYNSSYLSEAPTLLEGDVYEMLAIIRRTSTPSGSPRLKAEGNSYTAYPLQISQQGHKDGGIITGVTGIVSSAQPIAVEYVNLMGQRSKQPFPGINIVVTRFSDGSTTTTKQVIRQR